VRRWKTERLTHDGRRPPGPRLLSDLAQSGRLPRKDMRCYRDCRKAEKQVQHSSSPSSSLLVRSQRIVASAVGWHGVRAEREATARSKQCGRSRRGGQGEEGEAQGPTTALVGARLTPLTLDGRSDRKVNTAPSSAAATASAVSFVARLPRNASRAQPRPPFWWRSRAVPATWPEGWCCDGHGDGAVGETAYLRCCRASRFGRSRAPRAMAARCVSLGPGSDQPTSPRRARRWCSDPSRPRVIRSRVSVQVWV
jgi:hypothetical protein